MWLLEKHSSSQLAANADGMTHVTDSNLQKVRLDSSQRHAYEVSTLIQAFGLLSAALSVLAAITWKVMGSRCCDDIRKGQSPLVARDFPTSLTLNPSLNQNEGRSELACIVRT